MSLHIYNTKSHKKELFVPIEPDHVKMYVCGITVYDFCHIGHARSALVFDMIVNYLRHLKYKVTYVRNFTDIDDKIISRATEQKISCKVLTSRFIKEFYADMDMLEISRPTMEPKATDHIPEIISLVKDLEDQGFAYQVDNDVYFEVHKLKSYGALSGRNLEDLQAGARISINTKKRNPMDFALWKGSKPGEPTWESPWGPGRPGWHIECSAMSRKYLGESFDIHGGGEDLVFPHHENEMAQSEACSGKTFVNTWIHHAFVTIKDEKMSKSLHNFLTIREVLKEHHPEALRLTVFSTNYRHPLDYSANALKDAMSGLIRLYNCIANSFDLPDGVSTATAISTPDEIEFITTIDKRFTEAMDNDFNTAQALGIIFESVKIINRIRQKLPNKPSSADIKLIKDASLTIRCLANILGLLRQEPQDFIKSVQMNHLESINLTKEDLDQLIEKRLTARSARNWGRADEIRDQLLAQNIILKDSQTGTSWSVDIK